MTPSDRGAAASGSEGSSPITVLTAAPDLRRLYATAALRRGSGDDLGGRVARYGVHADPARVAAYARLCGFPVGGPLPPTYPHLLGFPLQLHVMTRPGFPLPLLGAVHVENRVALHRRLLPDEPLDLTVWAEALRPHRRGRQVDLVTRATVAGETVWEGVSTYLARGEEHPDAPRSEPPAPDQPTGIRPGPRWRLAEGAGRAYAAVSGDWNPIHVHFLTARPLGFRSAIAHGMYSYARVLAALGSRLPHEGLTSHVWFRRPVPLPSTVTLDTTFDATFDGHGSLSTLRAERGDTVHLVARTAW